MKSIFIIGDSISLYYHLYLKKFLKNKALYYRKGNETEIDEALHESNNIFSANGGDSSQVIEYMEQMIKKGSKYDILLINCGLHDIRTDRKNKKKQIEENVYKRNLNKIIELGNQLANKLIWISTTHVNNEIHNSRKSGYLRFNEDVIKYNKIASNIMKQNHIEIIDLYNFTKELECKEMYSDHVHFKDYISKKQAEYIYIKLEPLLK